MNQQEEDKWKDVRAKLQIGDEVEGKIMHTAPFGDFIDIGVGFPALLQIVDMLDMTPENYREGNYSQIGNIVNAKIVGFRDYSKQIILTQKPVN